MCIIDKYYNVTILYILCYLCNITLISTIYMGMESSWVNSHFSVMRVLLCLLALLAVPAQAQGSAPYALPISVRFPVGHVAEFALGDTAVGEPLTVAEINSPTWLRFDLASVKAVRETEEDPTARFVFTVLR